MFDTFLGLPLHVLVLHFTVVLVPISAIATTAVFLYRPWRETYGARMVVVNLAMLALALATVAAWLVARVTDLPESAGVGIGVVIGALAVASLVFTVLAGDTGSRSHWDDFVQGTSSN
jgi:hypothetical protein